MFKGQFIFRMILTAVCTVLFVYGAIWQARNHPVEKTKKRGVLRLAIAVLFAVLSLVFAAIAVMVIQDPHISAALNKFGTQGLVYTSQQFAFLRALQCAIVFLIIACYLFFFKKSNSKIWASVFKIYNLLLAFIVLMIVSCISFDFWGLFVLLYSGSFLAINIWIVNKYGYYE